MARDWQGRFLGKRKTATTFGVVKTPKDGNWVLAEPSVLYPNFNRLLGKFLKTQRPGQYFNRVVLQVNPARGLKAVNVLNAAAKHHSMVWSGGMPTEPEGPPLTTIMLSVFVLGVNDDT